MTLKITSFLLLTLFIWQIFAGSNPFVSKQFYVNPGFQAEVDNTIANCKTCDQATLTKLQKLRTISSAVWIDTKSKISGGTVQHVDGILEDAAKSGSNTLVLFIIYNLPNRDCHANASNGEICCKKQSDGKCDYSYTESCNDGLTEYKTQYIDPIVSLFSQYQSKVSIVAVIEPDSLPNLATNSGDPRCGNAATKQAYTEGITYAIKQLSSKAPGVALYLDAAHGGWLGWSSNSQAYASTIKSLGILPYIRGFATNVANYQPLGNSCPEWDWCLPYKGHASDSCCQDPCSLLTQYNPSNNELNYVQQLFTLFNDTMVPYFIVDTGRNGVDKMRSSCSNWCNIRNSGIGKIPSTETALPYIDAYFWLKTPGESDGCTQTLPTGTQCPRFDNMCGSQDSIGSINGEPRAPEAGQWFDYQIRQLVDNWTLELQDTEIRFLSK